ncbi:hypothetical protein DA803_02885 [[Mycoplasma] phocae]|uniref:DUF3800 domain-containing protein n=1 Tax=[Mycoplasma] phocae TaxID=142651 RepID=A0A2Z5IR03_9BACT|nr:DUF3800 domain-containing protein [[Mycoplasma] phocae]AXE61014.1 hypothetical protein DA803_02885 [[Mycoplasma] phocae]
MNISIFFDESGVFEPKNNNFYILSGFLFLNNNDKQCTIRKYRSVEKNIRHKLYRNKSQGLKTTFKKKASSCYKRML